MVGGALHVSGTTYHEGAFSATGSITTTENLYISGDTFYEGQLSGTGNITTTENLHVSGNTFYEGALSGTGNIETVGLVTATGAIKGAHIQSTVGMSIPSGGKYILDDLGGDTYISNGGTNNNVEFHSNNNLLLT